MRIDLPNDLPLERMPDTPSMVPPIEASPLELRREALNSRALDRKSMPQAPQNRRRQADPPRAVERRVGVSRDQRPHRHSIPPQAIGLSLRDEERRMLSDVGKFRVVRTRDLAEIVYGSRESLMQRDLTFLRQKGLIEVDAVNARRDGRGGRVERIEVVTLTKAGKSFLRLTSDLSPDQRLYAGLVKPREVEHDSQIYRAYLKEADRIEGNGGKNLRVKLDFELKSEVQQAIYAARKADPNRDMKEIKRQVAENFDLPFVRDRIQIPDARIVYDVDPRPDDGLEQGSRTGDTDIEVLTAAYSRGHLRAKAQAAFRNYASSSDRASVTSKIEDEHNLMQDILEL